MCDIGKYHLLIFSAGTSLNVIAVFISTGITAGWLLTKDKVHSNISKNKRYAAFTSIILSGVFCLFNMTGICLVIIAFLNNISDSYSQSFALRIADYINLTISLNSATNPIVYMARKKEMRQYISNIFTAIRKPVEDINIQSTDITDNNFAIQLG